MKYIANAGRLLPLAAAIILIITAAAIGQGPTDTVEAQGQKPSRPAWLPPPSRETCNSPGTIPRT